MTTGTNGRHEGDLRAAFTALEEQAPDADTVLRAVRERTGRRRGLAWPGGAGQRHQGGQPRPPRALRRPVLLTGVAAVALAAGLTAALVPSGSPAGQPPAAVQIPGLSEGTAEPPITSHSDLPAMSTVSKAMATAFSAADDDVLYTVESGRTHGYVPDAYQDWSWPAQPAAGQREYMRTYYVQTPHGKPGKLLPTEDNGFVYTIPRNDPQLVEARMTMVCYQNFSSGCGYGNTETPAGTWAVYHGKFDNPDAGLDDFSPQSMAQSIAQGDWRIIGRTRLDGQAALELTETSKAKDQYDPKPVRLWINAHSYLPIKMTNGVGTSQPSWNTWSFLTPTPAHLALLRPHIPASFPHSAGSRHGRPD